MTARIIILGTLLASASCTSVQHQAVWRVEKTEIALYHSSTADPASGNIAHVEYCGAKFSRGSDFLHIVYRPIDFPNRNPGFTEGDTVTVIGIDKAGDFGAVEGPDYWISDVKIAKSVTRSPSDFKDAAAYITNTYPSVIVTSVDSNTLGVIWESGAEDKFLELKTKVKSDFGFNVIIKAIE